MKYLVLLIVFVLAYAWWRSQRTSVSKPAARPLPPPQDMVACHHCGTHVPRSEAITVAQRHYCCAEHRRADGL